MPLLNLIEVLEIQCFKASVYKFLLGVNYLAGSHQGLAPLELLPKIPMNLTNAGLGPKARYGHSKSPRRIEKSYMIFCKLRSVSNRTYIHPLGEGKILVRCLPFLNQSVHAELLFCHKYRLVSDRSCQQKCNVCT